MVKETKACLAQSAVVVVVVVVTSSAVRNTLEGQGGSENEIMNNMYINLFALLSFCGVEIISKTRQVLIMRCQLTVLLGVFLYS